MLLDLVGKRPEEPLSIARRLREHCKYDGHTPLVIMPEKVPTHLEGTDEKVNHLEWICYYEDVDQLRQLMAPFSAIALGWRDTSWETSLL